MANLRKTYFLTPSFDYPPPPTGPIKLGNILSDPASPDRPLNPGKIIVSPPEDAVTMTVKTDWKSELSKMNSASVGLYAKFLELVVGVGVDAAVNWDHKNADEYSFARLETIYFNPLEVSEYLTESLEAPNVKAYIEKGWARRRPVYIITGLKVVRGGKLKSSKTRGHGGTLSVGVDGTALTVPVDAGPELEVQREKGYEVSWSTSDDFVFAYRLSRLKLKRKTQEAEEEEYNKGALYELIENQDGQEVAVAFEVDRLEDDDAVAGEYDDEELAEVEDDDGENAYVVIPSL
jgi:hypothetical protein